MRTAFPMMRRWALPVLLLWGCGGTSDPPAGPQPAAAPPAKPLFTLLSPAETQIHFQNTLTEGPNTNVLVYEYFYNGGGVAAGDFNGDGLTDLYFTANMESNRLYLNQGGMKFREVAEASGTAGRPGPWKTGVTLVDLNGDRRLDLYVSYSGMLPDPKRANQLFINQGNDAQGIPRFEEQAEAWGIAGTAFSNQAYFFDYDRDGDLDMLQLNHSPKSLPVLDDVLNASLLRQDDPQQGLRLFRQQNGKFTDVTQAAGLQGSPLSYGLGLGIADLNRDGWPDFYVSNDYAVPDYLYLNQQNGKFSNRLAEQTGHTSQFSMGNDIADVNNDAWPDIVTLDMLPEDNRRQKLLLAPDNYNKFDLNVRSGFHYQFMRNMLQLNNGDGSFSETGQLAGISNTDWSWAALLADYDNDGWKDLFVTNGYTRDYTNLDFIHYMGSFTQARGRLLREDVLQLVQRMPASNVVNYIFSSRDGLTFADRTRDWGMQRPSNSNGAAWADLDNDGDLDLIVNNINQPAFLYRNEARSLAPHHYLQVGLEGEGLNTLGIGAVVTVYAGGAARTAEQYPARGYLSAVEPVLHFGLGEAAQIDSLLVAWPDGKRQRLGPQPADQRITLRQADARPGRSSLPAVQALFREVPAPAAHTQAKTEVRDFNRQSLLICELSFTGPCMAQGDVNGDGREDLLIGGAAGQALALYLQQPGGRFSPRPVPAFEADKACADAALALFDANGDGHPDLYAASGGYHQFAPDDPLLQDRLYLNDGKGNFARAAEALPAWQASKGCVAAGDANGDGRPDLFVGGRVVPGRYPEPPRSALLINDGQGRFTDQTDQLAPALRSPGMVTAAAWADLDGNGAAELILAGEWMPVLVFSPANGRLEDHSARYFSQEYRGWWNSLQVADVNQDRRPDLLLGNAGQNLQFRASAQQPAELYYRDFDGNGSVDPIFCTYVQGVRYPYVTRDELLGQIGSMRQRFSSYESYADATLETIFGAEALGQAGHLTANHLATSLFLNQGAAPFALAELPVQAQYAPVHASEVLDANSDGHPDLLLCGNSRHFKLRLGYADANYGVLLLGDGQGGFRYLPQRESGLRLRGEVRSIRRVGQTLLFGIQEGPVRAYQLQRQPL
ncbi:MAG: VCBS repeat-containing protein [Bacteroidia bacterium]|nr:VCBS repeat-containing protein [Bacteroidia bacterium]